MFLRTITALSLALALGQAQAASYTCTVYCTSPSGKTSVRVDAGSSSDAASIVDKQGHQICRAAGHGGATSSTMSSGQCSKN